ncbi:MAG TPA: FAD-dependent oxidoreductase [Terriglobales bacterium]|nr:FAD-dependent oxidoreductase [Terriglobales bacterium]
MYDLAIIGGGPAGTAAAVTAAHYEARVLLLEKGSFPRNKVCGEFVSAESLALLGSLLPTGCDLIARAPRIQRTRVFIENRVLQVPIQPAAASIARTEFDAALWNSARDRGVNAREHQSVVEVEGEGPFTIRTAAEEFTCRSVIDASGRWSNLNRRENGNGPVKWLGVKAHFREENAAQSVDLYFFKGGYCGVQPVGADRDNRINVCAMIRSDIGRSLEESFRYHVELKNRSQTWGRLTDVVATSPLLFHDPMPRRGSILCAGDAAGFVDPFVGDGISLALRSGALAAGCLRNFIQGNGTLQQAAQSYDRAYRHELSDIFQSSSRIRRLFTFPAPIRAGILYSLTMFPALTRRMIRNTR